MESILLKPGAYGGTLPYGIRFEYGTSSSFELQYSADTLRIRYWDEVEHKTDFSNSPLI